MQLARQQFTRAAMRSPAAGRILAPARPRILASATPASTRDHCFALETMEVDGQSWVLDELGQKVVGLTHKTPRAACRTTQLLGYSGDLEEGMTGKRCDRLDLQVGWEATARAAEGTKFTGQAQVTLSSKDNRDVVDVCVQVDPACLEALPGERDRLVRDVVYAVESLDTAIMEQLNDFLWSMERRNNAGAHEAQ
ncbi:hypothetical protein HYH03_003079 [Edaphochlamys debaryana]|uniref:Uncharacterized protein n=1 Tax=Edaphochlamys debaryana TaxID=47281 RepID=A0A835YA48_9CHLO|nr:hypothetical protein HYH03_003079 [Edaphochlamys debaryana]|eukprot:KAG2498888.1 hypothetical protein HYH03_003079 [Edaphochlamys debaryana]